MMKHLVFFLSMTLAATAASAQPGGSAQTVAPPADATQPPDIDSFLPEHIAAIEYYAGPATTPTEFAGTGASCGTIVIWTRTAGESP